MTGKSIQIRKMGFSSIMAMFFIVLFSMLAISFSTMSNLNVKMSRNHRDISSAQAAAESGLEYINFLVNAYTPPEAAYTSQNSVETTEAQDSLGFFAQHVQDYLYGSTILNGHSVTWDSGDLLLTVPPISLADNSTANFNIACNFEEALDDEDYHKMIVTCTGVAGDVSRSVQMVYPIQKDAKVLEYAIASRGRIWLTGDSTIDGDLYSSWDNITRSPFNITADSTVNGTVNTVFDLEDVENAAWQMETLDEDGNPMFDESGSRIYSPDDEVQGQHDGINYDQASEVPGMSISDYDTDEYNSCLTSLSSSPDIEVEYFPHAAGDYNYPRDGSPSNTWNRRLSRHVYENENFTDVRLPDNYNALFKNCTFNGTLYIDCYKSGSSKYNNVRFEDCDFNGVIVTDVPQQFKWKENCLYFTGGATFNNSALEEATILAPHFNVNLGNANPVGDDTNELTGAIVGGIVDVRGNADIYGTIISMCDTTNWTSGYVTNIGVTLDDGGSETSEPGDIGVINITPDKKKMLPSGITTPVVILRDGGSYVEL